ncbi:hypothetical protein BJ138DRAFT_1106110 [Hygrophoropsis aurantiaca]|uniref:Uncharacterized protein n=1 Tax=Hygrophoropsis aurantiaca TaxID=72124 RepID=A0ACB7ZWM9_9AGAM|nr:hypothetical protein BJ138DRAFT_1106110 [Hygrophoropsis aurantiaca]
MSKSQQSDMFAGLECLLTFVCVQCYADCYCGANHDEGDTATAGSLSPYNLSDTTTDLNGGMHNAGEARPPARQPELQMFTGGNIEDLKFGFEVVVKRRLERCQGFGGHRHLDSVLVILVCSSLGASGLPRSTIFIDNHAVYNLQEGKEIQQLATGLLMPFDEVPKGNSFSCQEPFQAWMTFSQPHNLDNMSPPSQSKILTCTVPQHGKDDFWITLLEQCPKGTFHISEWQDKFQMTQESKQGAEQLLAMIILNTGAGKGCLKVDTLQLRRYSNQWQTNWIRLPPTFTLQLRDCNVKERSSHKLGAIYQYGDT